MHAYCGLGMRLGRIIVECCFTICMADAAAVMITPDFSIFAASCQRSVNCLSQSVKVLDNLQWMASFTLL